MDENPSLWTLSHDEFVTEYLARHHSYFSMIAKTIVDDDDDDDRASPFIVLFYPRSLINIVLRSHYLRRYFMFLLVLCEVEE